MFRREGVGPGGEEKVSVFFRGGSEGGRGGGREWVTVGDIKGRGCRFVVCP